MKKNFFISIFLAFASAVGVAQTQYKFEKGNVSTELQLSLFSFSAKIDYDDETFNYSTGPFSMPGLRLRCALTEKLLLRTTVGLDFGHNTIKKNLDDSLRWYYPYDPYPLIVITGTSTDKNKYTEYSIALGLEYHLGNWERISVYLGGELFFGQRITNGTAELDQRAEYFSYNWADELVQVMVRETTNSLTTKNCKVDGSDYIQNGMMSFGINLVTGMDFFIYKGLYVGAELGLGYGYASFLKGSAKGTSKMRTHISSPPDETIFEDNINKKLDDKINSGNLSFRCNPMIRLGWRF